MGFVAPPLRLAALLLLTLPLAHTALAQQGSQPRGWDSEGAASERRSGSNFHSSFASSEFAAAGRVVVKGAPFTATAVSETVQALSDGSSVRRTRAARLYRDGEGRVRIEIGRGAGRGEVYSLYDAESGATYIVSSGRRAPTLAAGGGCFVKAREGHHPREPAGER